MDSYLVFLSYFPSFIVFRYVRLYNAFHIFGKIIKKNLQMEIFYIKNDVNPLLLLRIKGKRSFLGKSKKSVYMQIFSEEKISMYLLLAE